MSSSACASPGETPERWLCDREWFCGQRALPLLRRVGRPGPLVSGHQRHSINAGGLVSATQGPEHLRSQAPCVPAPPSLACSLCLRGHRTAIELQPAGPRWQRLCVAGKGLPPPQTSRRVSGRNLARIVGTAHQLPERLGGGTGRHPSAEFRFQFRRWEGGLWGLR